MKKFLTPYCPKTEVYVMRAPNVASTLIVEKGASVMFAVPEKLAQTTGRAEDMPINE